MIKYVAFALAIVVALPACASDWDWDMRSGSPTAHRGRVAYYHRKHHPKPRVMAYERRSVERAERQDEDGGGKCVEKVRGLGTQWIGTKGALDAAKKDWMERVRYDHGESFVDMTNDAFFIDHKGGTIAKAILLVENAVVFNDGAFEIAEQRKRDANLVGKFLVSGNTVNAHAKNLSVG